ncbi:MAG: UDP-glucose 4-epimerase GalE [Gammaproteobacteria bacterium]|nr:UDP-glucose 4-epimerase GalE [Gammaproteobacteria bacterium]
MKILVVGGAGYIGSHMVKLLGERRCAVTTLDDLSSGHRDAVLTGDFVQGDMADTELLRSLFARRKYDAVMHFASFIEVGESVREPAKYYRNNVANTLTLLSAMREAGVDRFIFSSTAAIFGTPQYVPIDERHPRAPINPYGRTKNMVEDVLGDYERAYGLRSVCLRYFNAAGADPQGKLSERHDPESHLIPLALQAASGRRAGLSVYGTDYDTPDGTCIRDYVHVSDLCEAHWLALESLRDGASSQAYNLGNGNGFSVLEVIETAKKVTGVDFAVKHEERRAGDPPRLVADSSAIKSRLGWSPRYADLDTIVAHAWAFERARKPS